jgi:HlyD family secretion protein
MPFQFPARSWRSAQGRITLPLVGLVMLVVAATAFFALRSDAVAVVRVEQGELRQAVVASGRVRTPQRIEVSAQVAGLVREVAVQEGAHVEPGQTLVRLDEREAQAAVAQALAAVNQAEARLRQIRELSLPAAAQLLRQAEAQALQAGRQFERIRELVARGFYSQAQLDEAARAREVADSQLLGARLQQSSQQPGGSEVELAQRSLEQARASLALAEAKLAHTHLRAPHAATVLTRAVETGDTVQPGRTLLTLAPVAATELTVQIDERNLALLRSGQRAVASADAYPGERFAATISHIAPAVDALRGSVEVRLHVPQAPAYLKHEMTVSIDIEVAYRSQALIVAADTLREADGQAPWVMVVRDGRTQRVAVRPGMRDRNKVEIFAGLVAGDALLPAAIELPEGHMVRIRK